MNKNEARQIYSSRVAIGLRLNHRVVLEPWLSVSFGPWMSDIQFIFVISNENIVPETSIHCQCLNLNNTFFSTRI